MARSDRDQEGGRIGVWGASGSGKSSWVKQRLNGTPRVVVFDPQDEYGGLRGFRRFTQATTADMQRHILGNWRSFRVAYVPPAGAEAEALSALAWYLATLQDTAEAQGKPRPKLTLVAEELNLAFPTHGATRCTGFAELCSRGRRRHIELIGVSQRIAEVSSRFRGNCTEQVIFRQGEKTDRERAAANAGVRMDEIFALKRLEYFHLTDAGDRDLKKIRFR